MTERDGLQYLHRRADGRHVYRIRPYVGIPRRRVSATFDMPTDSIKAARRAANEVVEELERVAKADDKDFPTVGRLLDDWITRGTTKSPRTLYGYRQRADKITAKFGTVRADQLTPDMIDGWYHDMRTAGTSEAELLEIHRVFSAALQWARKLRRITEAATEFIPDKPKHKAPKIEPPSPELMRTLLVNLPDAEWARFVSLLVLTGARRGEVAGLRWADVGVTEMWIRSSVIEVPGQPQEVRPYPKSGEHRNIELHPATSAVLELQRTYIAESTTATVEWVFPDWESWRYRLPRRPSSINRAWGRYRIKHGAKQVRLHDLRHFHATQALAAGARIHDVANQLGHRDVATTMRIYGHATDEGRRVVTDAVAGVLGFINKENQ